jgi:hypothetical protein
VGSLGPDAIRRQAEAAEVESRHFYERAAARTTDLATRQLLDDLVTQAPPKNREAEAAKARARAAQRYAA